GSHVAVDDASAAAPWHVHRRTALHVRRVESHAQRRHAVRSEPRRGRGNAAALVGRRARPRAASRKARRRARSATAPLSAAVTSETLARWVLGVLAALIVLVLGWQLSHGFGIGRIALTALLVTPLLLPLRGLVRGNRRTYAWATLCVIPYFILGVTEAIANPQQRVWSGLCLLLALTLFASLIGYLRLTRPS